jgi:hypothetical protein
MLWSGDICCFWLYGNGVMRNPALGLRSINLPRTRVNKGKKREGWPWGPALPPAFRWCPCWGIVEVGYCPTRVMYTSEGLAALPEFACTKNGTKLFPTAVRPS